MFSMTSAFSWQNSISLWPASFCTSKPNLPISWDVLTSYFCIPVPYNGKDIFFWVLVLEVLVSQFSSVTQSCPTLCDPMDCSTSGLPVHHQLPEFTPEEGLVGLVEPFSFFSITGWGIDLDYYNTEWFALETEIILSFLRLHPSTAFQTRLLIMMGTSFLLRHSCPQ